MTINASNLAQGNSVTKLCTKAVPKTKAIIPMYNSAYQKRNMLHMFQIDIIFVTLPLIDQLEI